MWRPLNFIPVEPKINFLKWRRWAAIFSLALVLLSVGLTLGRGLNFGIDFRGGLLLEVRMQETLDLGALRQKLAALDLGEVALQEFGGETDILIRIQRQEGDEAAQLAALGQVKDALPETVEYRRTEFVGPQVGDELIRAGILAVVLSLAGIMIYIWFRFEWQFSVGAIIALVHDVLSTIGLFALLDLEFNLSSIAAILLIAGYSINDTVVIYDRVRENMRRYKKMPLFDLINLSVNQTLSRTIMTSATTLTALLALYIFGGEVIADFTFAMIWGIFIGTYSTVFVATALLLRLPPERAVMDNAETDSAPETGST